jgi:hypothetical protein
MQMSLQHTREALLAYAQASLTQEDTTGFLSDTVVSTLMNTGEEVRGRSAVTQQIATLQTHASDIRPKHAIFGEGHVAVELDFVLLDGTIVPYTIIYDFDGTQIAAIRFYFAGNVPA